MNLPKDEHAIIKQWIEGDFEMTLEATRSLVRRFDGTSRKRKERSLPVTSWRAQRSRVKTCERSPPRMTGRKTA
jgi:hypothetical protein